MQFYANCCLLTDAKLMNILEANPGSKNAWTLRTATHANHDGLDSVRPISLHITRVPVMLAERPNSAVFPQQPAALPPPQTRQKQLDGSWAKSQAKETRWPGCRAPPPRPSAKDHYHPTPRCQVKPQARMQQLGANL